MGEVRGFGITHYPPIQGKDETMIETFKRNLRAPDVPESAKDPANWPEMMQKEWADQLASAAAHRAHLVRDFDTVRAALDEFNPDVVIMFGDDQWELFHEDFVPPFCVLAFEDTTVKPFASKSPYRPDFWDEGPEHERVIHMDRNVGRYFTRELLKQDIDVSYAYQPRGDLRQFPHAFLNAILYLDYHRTGFPYTLLPIAINCHGTAFVAGHGTSHLSVTEKAEVELDPPSASPERLMQFGAAVARAAEASPYKCAIMASSGWSHASLNYKEYKLIPDVAADKRLYELLMSQDYKSMRNMTDDEIDGAGEQESRNWFCLAGAMEELDQKPVFKDFVETFLFNSSKVFAVYK